MDVDTPTPSAIGALVASYVLPKVGTKKRTSERSELVRFFLEKINESRAVDGYPPLTGRFAAIRMAHYTLDQLYGLRSGFSDRLSRNDLTTATKWWWFTTTTIKADS